MLKILIEPNISFEVFRVSVTETAQNSYDISLDVKCPNVIQLAGSRNLEWAFSRTPAIKFNLLKLLQEELRRKLPEMVGSVDFLPDSTGERIVGAICSEPYLVATLQYITTVKEGPKSVFPPDGSVLDVGLVISDSFRANVRKPSGYVQFDSIPVEDLHQPWPPYRLKMGGTHKPKFALMFDPIGQKIGGYGYLPAEVEEGSVRIKRSSCPKPGRPKKISGDWAYCHWGGDDKPQTCRGFGGYQNDMVLCKYLNKKTSGVGMLLEASTEWKPSTWYKAKLKKKFWTGAPKGTPVVFKIAKVRGKVLFYVWLSALRLIGGPWEAEEASSYLTAVRKDGKLVEAPNQKEIQKRYQIELNR